MAPSASGRATFGFVSKYQKGVSTPTGNTEFQFNAGGLNFSSTSYDWFVISGARAQDKGSGTVNGMAGYKFLLTATDGAVNAGEEPTSSASRSPRTGMSPMTTCWEPLTTRPTPRC